MKIIFDIGSNNGDDIPYYMLKADRVVAFEANPLLCQLIEERFSEEIADGRLILERGILCADKDASNANSDFFIHKHNHVLSQFPKPDSKNLHDFTKVVLPIRTLSSVLERYGVPHYAKIDIEHYDQVILSEFFRLSAYPTYLSAECHSQEVVSLILECPKYTGFKLVVGENVSVEYSEHSIERLDGERVSLSFPHHSAGPFGEDIAGVWYDSGSMYRLLRAKGLGWKDLHSSREDTGWGVDVPISFARRRALVKDRVRKCIPGSVLNLYRTLR